MRHHTKDKGDSGLGFIIADLMSKGIQVAIPISEHLPFDCIAISERNKLIRLSAKYRKKKSRGSIEVVLRSTWADRHGNHAKQQDKDLFDATAIYCPDNRECYYVLNSEVEGQSICLRFELTKNNQIQGVKMASDFRDPNRLFIS